jgi:hypothetical protein
MRKEIAVLLGLVAFATKLNATDINLHLGPSNDHVTGETSVSFSDLNGTPLNGSNLTLNFTFNEVVRLLADTRTDFELAVLLDTNASGWSNDASATLHSLDQNGNQNSISEGGAFPPVSGGQDIGLGFGLFPLTFNDGSLVTPFSFHGAHADMILPLTDGATITGARVAFYGNDYAFGPHVPDSGSTLTLLALALIGLCYVASRANRSLRPVNGAPPK